MLITEVQSEERLRDERNVIVRLNMHSGGTGVRPPVSPETKEFLGTLGHLSGLRTKVLASMSGLHERTIATYKAGESTPGLRDPELYEAVKGNVESHKEKAKDIVIQNLLSSLGVVSQKLPGAKLLEANEVAKSSAFILEKLDGGTDGGVKVTNIVIHNPGTRPIEEYVEVEVIAGGKK